MQISKGVEWAVHAASLLNGLPAGRGLKAEALARYHDVPAAYMAKQLQALSKAGITKTSRGAHGGYRLAKPADQISLWDITAAVDGNSPAFRCTEIRQNGPCALKSDDCKRPCQIAAAFASAELAFRDNLASISLADIAGQVVNESEPEHLFAIVNWLNAEAEPLSDKSSL